MLMDTRLDATQQDYARTAQASGKVLITLINEVLDQAKIESGRLELEAVPFDLRAILDDVLSLFSGKSRDEGIEVSLPSKTPLLAITTFACKCRFMILSRCLWLWSKRWPTTGTSAPSECVCATMRLGLDVNEGLCGFSI